MRRIVCVESELLDHLSNRSFRRTLLCREHHVIADEPRLDCMAELHLSMKGYVDGEVDLTEGLDVTFVRRDGERIVVENSLVKAALGILNNAQPASVAHGELMAGAAAQLDLELDDSLLENLQRVLLFCMARNWLSCFPSLGQCG